MDRIEFTKYMIEKYTTDIKQSKKDLALFKGIDDQHEVIRTLEDYITELYQGLSYWGVQWKKAISKEY